MIDFPLASHLPSGSMSASRTMNIRLLSRSLTSLLLAILCVTTSLRAQQPAAKPNLLIVLCDDLRWDHLGCAGHPNLKTPHIDRLAHEGVRFANAFCTTSLCSPSRASILSGQYAHKHGVTNNFTEFPAEIPSLQKNLHDAG